MKNPVLEVIHSRRSIRKYKDKVLSKEQIEDLVKAALISPSSMNQQPWHIKVLTKQSIILEWERDIVNHFVSTNNIEIIQRMKSRNNKVFYDAPAVFVISMEEGKAMDVGIMAQTIALAAKSMGLESVILGFPRVSFESQYENKWQEKLGFPDNYLYGIAVAVGYGDAEGNHREPDMSKVSYLE